MARKQLRTVLKPFDIKAWIKMDGYRTKAAAEKSPKKAATLRKKALVIRNQLVEQNRPYAVKVACSFQRSFARACDLQDLIQCACLGLSNAVDKFNPRKSKTYKLEDFDPAKGGFTSYASRYILAELRKWSRRDKVLFRPLHEEVAKKYKEDYKAFVAKHERPPQKGEMGHLPQGVTLNKIARACEPNPAMCSLDAEVSHGPNGRDTTLYDMLPDPGPNPEEVMIRKEEEFQELLDMTALPADELVAVTGYVIEERNYVDVGERMTPPRPAHEVQALVKSGLARLRAQFGVTTQ